ncbi:MAG: carbamoyl-phosphate synthase (glutamine-hydrolyzing) small subunit [Planctomycetota bacterium]|nr:MAG: carbamoyl-phosphate synthase (glutamine-hydrolyzing) small subunit [Planctomycetota bacterium]
MKAFLELVDGTKFYGEAKGALRSVSGEVVFTTSMVGYPEAISDPSYYGQILVFTQPMIGNYGVPASGRDEWGLPFGLESEHAQVRGIVVQELWEGVGHLKMERRLVDWLRQEGVVALCGVDTRALTKRLRECGTMLGRIVVNGKVPEWDDPNARDVLGDVVWLGRRRFGSGKKRVLLVDCGCKASILRSLLERKVAVLTLPYGEDILRCVDDVDGVLLSNGPGDPAKAERLIGQVRELLRRGIAVFGICLGNQILGLAAGARTYKLRYGHRSSNQPVEDLRTGKGFVTSQNHGFAVDGESLPPGWEVTHRNANDGTVEGLADEGLRAFGVQFHPEARPGPTDAAYLFDTFLEALA